MIGILYAEQTAHFFYKKNPNSLIITISFRAILNDIALYIANYHLCRFFSIYFKLSFITIVVENIKHVLKVLVSSFRNRVSSACIIKNKIDKYNKILILNINIGTLVHPDVCINDPRSFK